MTGSGGYYAIDVATGVYLVNAEAPGYVFTQTLVQAISGAGISRKACGWDPCEQRSACHLAVMRCSNFLQYFAIDSTIKIG